jgi:ThiF family
MPEHEFHVPDEPEIPAPNPVDPIYLRQASMGLARPNVVLIGAGGVGCWVALSLVLGGVDSLTIYDSDTLSTHNLNRFPLPESFVGEAKSVALVKWLETLRPKASLLARGEFDPAMNPPTMMAGSDWIICATDSLKSRRMCYEFANVDGWHYLEVGADGERWTLSPAPPEFSTDDEANPGYQTVPVHVGPCMMAGAAAAYYVLHDCKPILSHSAGWVKGPLIRGYPNLGALKFESMSEVDLTDSTGGVEFFTCPDCGIKIEQDIIMIIRHHREHHPEIGLAEAKAWAEHQLEQLRAREPEVDEMGNAILDDIDVEEVEDGEA